ncbi:hypothetical protein [Desulfoferula mesophila]|uniref:Uncharacterized protein n=1 Tax=Desulfoferula mesophila TaxID=3058419 RepID=A0AAU9ECJ2_9BACT|nr:hypothetical protein FAK_00700 [Desulfoferula mesophilus]
MSFLGNLGNCFAAGAFGGLANALVAWIAGSSGITFVMHVSLSPVLTPAFVYQRMVWGGIWGLLFMLPLFEGSVLWRGFLYSLGPTLVQLLVVFPYVANEGLYGTGLGALTPLFVIIFNVAWGWAAAGWVTASSR